MKQTDYLLTIENPCEADWYSMSKTEGGKYCLHCSKNVADFTSLSDEQIIRILENYEGKLCGRLSSKQLNRVMTAHQPAPHTKLFKILAGLLLMGNSENAKASNKTANLTNIIALKKIETAQKETFTKVQKADTSIHTITGRVLNEKTAEPVAYASVKLMNTSSGVATDNEGFFKLIIPDELLNDSIYLRITSVAFESLETAISKHDLPNNKIFSLKPSELEVTVGAVVVVRKKRKWWQFRKKHRH